ncbi:MAG: DUF4097 family beta strand repeat-containing protein [Melioribacteraceae bacterium]|nr:DUF4097 family beta strand repeat-containing protein [Melioribacteraceae bacterium]
MLKMKITSIIFLLFAVSLASAELQQEAIAKTLTAKKGGTLEVKVNPGDIQINTWEKDQVLVKVDGLDQDDEKALKLDEQNGNVTVNYTGKWGWGRSAEYSITVPQNYNLDLHTTGGDIEIETDINGNVAVNTMGGDIELKSVSGNVKLETMGGDISLNNVDGTTYLSTQGGDIKADNLKGFVEGIKTMGGDIEIESIAGSKKVTTFGGRIKVNLAKEKLEVTTFGGNIELGRCLNGVDASTHGGNIAIKEANGKVDVSTGGGNISLHKINGEVRAKTGAGNIYLGLQSLTGKSNLRTGSGDIEIQLSSGIKAEVYADVESYNRNGKDLIKSDFEGRISTERHNVIGQFEINGGGPEINLRVNNGTVTIKKQ